jgi:hypothetical protein
MPRSYSWLLALVLSVSTSAAEPPDSGSNSRSQDVNRRGDHVMGFSHDATTHHFHLYANGGDIEVDANRATDQPTVEQIRMHLGHIAQMFAGGNFNAPIIIHDTHPPGVSTLIRLRGRIQYQFGDTYTGARVRISSTSPEAIDAIHAFLLFQIIDHGTGDSPTIQDASPSS